ncbi:hypothetical protein BSKO_12938 [Bryopsis sp. KO-2023]|nr:hypothetical protein BSKO_12938 [Bryopsis sp. KO-2023]
MTPASACPVFSTGEDPAEVTLSTQRNKSESDIEAPQVAKRSVRKKGKYTMKEVRRHKAKDDAWIVVHGKVYDISEHIINHPGWETAAISTVLSIIAHSGMDCTEEFVDIHRPYPIAWSQLKAYYIGELVESDV